jgi:hypothetical protein
MKGFRTSCSFSFPELSCRKGRLRQEAVRRTEGRPRLPRPLHPPRRDLELASHRTRREGRHLQVEGLPDQKRRPAQDHDARGPRVHPPLSPARVAERIPPHPTLRPVGRRGSHSEHRARAAIARPVQGPDRQRTRRRRQRRRSRFVLLPMPMLRRPDDHRRDLRRPASYSIAIAEPDQDRHIMTRATPSASHRRSVSPPAARRNTSVMSARGRQPSFDRAQRLAPAHRRHRKQAPATLPLRTPSATGCRRPARQPPAILKSP